MTNKDPREITMFMAAKWVLIALFIGFVLALLVVPARAFDCGMRIADCGMKIERQYKLAALAAFALIDYKQSAGCVTQGGAARELNSVLGNNPTRRDMAAFGAIGIGLTWLASELLPPSWATLTVDSVLASEQFNIEENQRVDRGEKRRIHAIPVIVSWRW